MGKYLQSPVILAVLPRISSKPSIIADSVTIPKIIWHKKKIRTVDNYKEEIKIQISKWSKAK